MLRALRSALIFETGSMLVLMLLPVCVGGYEEGLRQPTEQALDEAILERQIMEKKFARWNILFAQTLIESDRPDEARRALWAIPEAARNWEWGYVLRMTGPDHLTLVSSSPPPRFRPPSKTHELAARSALCDLQS